MVFIGNQTSCWASRPTEPFGYALAESFDAFEWFPDKKPGLGWDETDLEPAARNQICQAARERGMRLSVHVRWQADPFTADGMELFEKDIQLAREVGAVLLNIHLVHERGVPAFIGAILPVIQKTAEAGLQLAIENTPHHSPEQFNELFAALRQQSVPVGHVGMCLDIGHANLSSATLNDYLGFFDRLDPAVPLIHLHLHENWGDSDSHLTLFTGPASQTDAGVRGLLDRLKHRQFTGSLILEQWPQPPSLLVQARSRLLKLWGPRTKAAPEPPATRPAAKAPPPPAEATDPFVRELAAENQRRRSWREKLELVGRLLAREQPPITGGQLGILAVYLKFLGAGQIACTEDGRHFRPAHHAKLAAEIHNQLTKLQTAENEFVLRKIYPALPSSAETFQRPEPLTRIRDIAHRNDIDSELKREIKTRLQNKLHRCAGPEDLVTSSELLERVTAPGAHYSVDFVEQFKIFHQELREFFNARTLDERLHTLLNASASPAPELIRRFLRQKPGNGLENHLATLHTLTELREALQADRPSREAEAQERIAADISLEEFAFVLLSQIANECDQADPWVASPAALEALELALENSALSGVDRLESAAVLAELRAWGRWGPDWNRVQVLRLRASLLRCRRLAADFGARTVALFSASAEKLGHALGVAEDAIRVFSERDVRSHLVFQISKLADGLLSRIRRHLRLSPWDVVVPGRAIGRAESRASLEDGLPFPQSRTVLFLDRSSGDEEIPKEVAGIALAHEMPHLAHLSVRARQAGVVMATCEEPGEFGTLRRFEGQWVCFEASPERVIWNRAPADALPTSGPARRTVRLPQINPSGEPSWLPLEQAKLDLAGGKALGAWRLAELAQQVGAGFRTPRAMVIPFGVLESALAARPATQAEYRSLMAGINDLPPEEFAARTHRLGELLEKLAVPEAICAEARRRFGTPATLAVRSSANGEDLGDFAGAGLYESKLNIPMQDLAEAVRSVWASLWTRRAAESRRAAGVPHEQAHMAVLVQEFLSPEVSFVLHTVNPVNAQRSQLYAELVVGLGETLASAAVAGSPYRLAVDKDSQTVTTLGFANFSRALRPATGGALRSETVDYSKTLLSREPSALEKLGQRLMAIGSFVERALGGPQDIEGAVFQDHIYLVQARAQQGLGQ